LEPTGMNHTREDKTPEIQGVNCLMFCVMWFMLFTVLSRLFIFWWITLTSKSFKRLHNSLVSSRWDIRSFNNPTSAVFVRSCSGYPAICTSTSPTSVPTRTKLLSASI
jgi:hypothetical protein